MSANANPAMSTQVQELPNTPPPSGNGNGNGNSNKSEEDPLVTDVINEMEREFMNQTIEPKQFNVVASQPPQPHMMAPQFAPPPSQYYPMMQQKVNKSDSYITIVHGVTINKDHLQVALLSAACAYALFYPIETGFLYEKVAILSKLAPYDRLIRTFLLAVLFYVLLTRLT
jgi:hypothetical protein